MRKFLIVAALAWPALAFAVSSDTIDPSRISEGIRILASDDFEGRAPDSDGGRKAVSYIVDSFKRAGLALDRETLKAPFYSQCYVAALFAFGLSAGINIMRAGRHEMIAAGSAIALLSLLWYLVVEVRWFRHDLGIGRSMALWLVVRTVLEAIVLVVLASLALSYGLGNGRH